MKYLILLALSVGAVLSAAIGENEVSSSNYL